MNSPTRDNDVTAALRDYLRAEHVEFREIHHAATFTSEESAAARGEELRFGGKALVMKVDDRFCNLVLPANRKLNSAAIRGFLRARKTRFATRDELHEMTGLVPGSVPPFGRPILPFDLYADETIQQNRRIAFNAGSLTMSFVLPVSDYIRAAQPTFFSFARSAES